MSDQITSDPTFIAQMKEIFGTDNCTFIEGPVPDLTYVYGDDRFVTNPLNHPEFVDDRKRLLDAGGFLTLWIRDWLNGSRDELLAKHMADAYGYPCFDIPMTGEVDVGVYKFEGDPDLYPLIGVNVGMPVPLYIYQYAIVAFPCSDGSYQIVRMD